MASGRIKGITIEIGGDTKKLTDSLKGVDSKLSTTKTALKDVEKLLKLNPGNVTLLQQKQKLLNDAIKLTKERLGNLKTALTNDLPTDQMQALQREVIATEGDLSDLEDAADGAADAAGDLDTDAGDAKDSVDDLGESSTTNQVLLANLAKEGLDKAADAAKKLAKYAAGAVKDSGEYADEVLTMSTQYGMSTDQIQEFMYMSELTDTDIGTLTGSMTKLTKGMGEMGKTGEASDEMKQLGVEVFNTDGTMRSADEVFMDVIDSLGQMDSGVERDSLAMAIFGKSAQELNPLIETGSEGIAAYAQEAHDMGAVLDEDALTSLGDMDDEFQRVEQAGKALKTTIATALAPAITSITKGITKLSTWFQNLDGKQKKALLTIVGIVAAIAPLIAVVTKVIGIIKGLGAIFSVVSAGPAALIVAAIAAVIAIGVLLYKNWDKIKEWATKLWEKLKAIFGKIKETISNAWTAVKTKATEVWTAIKTKLTEIWTAIKTKVSDTWNAIKTKISDTWNNIKEKASSTWNNIKTNLSQKWASIKQKASDTWNNMKTAASTAWSNIKTTIQNNGGGIKGVIKTALDGYKTLWTNGFNAINTLTGGKLGAALTTVQNKLNSIKTAFQNKLTAAKTAVSNIINAIKNLFNFNWSLPSLKLPHITITGGFSLSPLKVPKFNISWYRKAYDNPMLFSSPTVLPTANGMKGFGDGNGAELVIGLDKLREVVGGGAVVNNITIVQQPGQSQQELADLVAQRIQQKVVRARAVTA
jgi:TP901 family phage tail tape measure protein